MMTYTFIDVLISFILALIMLGIGMSIDAGDFRAVAKRPRAFFVGLAGQMILLPLFAFLLASFSGLDPSYQVGIVILSLCPGGNTSNYVSYLVKANTALSISLTSINGILTLFSIPLITNFALAYFMGDKVIFNLPFLPTVVQIILVTLLPASIGVWIRYTRQELSEKLEKPIRWITMVLLLVAFAILIFGNNPDNSLNLNLSDIKTMLPALLVLNIVGLSLGILSGRIAGLSRRNAVTLAIEIGLQNTTLAILIGGTLLGNSEMIKPALVYAGFSFWTTLAFAFWTRQRTPDWQ
ncbi:MAG: hypothetical protein DHS20C18_06540 [Saprospiraceae bacterium]|nr:MAG: hypothetical protein DHS20C18_06540 [Saprospiraceae bacterium]